MINTIRMLTSSVVLVVVMLSQGGCCSIVSGTSQNVSFNSTPAGATVRVNGMPTGQTPVTLPLKRGSANSVTIEKEGFEPYGVALSRGMNGWVFGNILFGGLIGLVVDVANGAIYSISPDSIYANLTPKQNTNQTTPLPPPAQPIVPAAVAPSVTDKLRQLKTLMEGGYITEDEYKTKKQQLIDTL